MKTYIKPISDPINVATQEIMNGMSQIAIPFIPDTNVDNTIGNGDEVLGNENYVWDKLDKNF